MTGAGESERNMVEAQNTIDVQLHGSSARGYLERTVRLWLGLRKSHAVEIPEMPDYLKRLFLRSEEYTNKHRDQWGVWEHPFSLNYQEGRLWTPEVDCWTSEIRNSLLRDGVQLEPLWPDGRAFALCLTHDVDVISEQPTVRQKVREINKYLSDKSGISQSTVSRRVLNAARPLVRGVLGKTHAFPSTEKTIEVVLEIEKEFGVLSTFFFTAYPLSKYSQYDCHYSLRDPCKFRRKNMRVLDMMRMIVEGGFDIGLHGSYFSATDAAMLGEQRKMIEDAAGTEVVTTRQHWLNWDINATPRHQFAAGLLADSTLGFNRNVGFRGGVALPYYFFDVLSQETIPILEVPLVIHDGPLLSSDGLEYDFDMARDVMKRLTDRVVETSGCMTISFHPHSFLDDVYERLYRWAIQYCIERNGWVTSLKGIYEWWKKREKLLEE